MQRSILLTLATLVLSGCSGNQVTISNDSYTQVTLNFRSQEVVLDPGAAAEITDIPNGTYGYSTVYAKPADVLSENVSLDGNLGGEMSFFNWNTEISVRYLSLKEPNITKDSSCVTDTVSKTTTCAYSSDTVWTYQIGASISTNKPSSATGY